MSSNDKAYENIEQAAVRLRKAQETRTLCLPMRDLIEPDDISSAYAVQHKNVAHWLSQGRRRVGSKIALSSKAIQEKLKIGHPTYGQLFADMCLADGADVEFDALIQSRLETEIALVIDRPLDHEQHTVADIISAIAYALPAFEIVGCRISDWNVTAADFIADNSAGSHFILGTQPKKLADFDIVRCRMSTLRHDEEVSSGSGAACYGNPLRALTWLADTLARDGNPLLAGDIIMTGALGPMVPIQRGDVFRAEIEGLGPISARFE